MLSNRQYDDVTGFQIRLQVTILPLTTGASTDVQVSEEVNTPQYLNTKTNYSCKSRVWNLCITWISNQNPWSLTYDRNIIIWNSSVYWTFRQKFVCWISKSIQILWLILYYMMRIQSSFLRRKTHLSCWYLYDQKVRFRKVTKSNSDSLKS